MNTTIINFKQNRDFSNRRKLFTEWKESVFGVFLVRIFSHSDWIGRDTPYLSIFSPNAGKYGPENSEYGHFSRSGSPFQSLNMLPLHIRPERWKLTYYRLISNVPRCYFKTGTISPLFLESHVFAALEFDSNYFGILLWKIIVPRDHNDSKRPLQKYSENMNQSDIVLQCPEKNGRAHL